MFAVQNPGFYLVCVESMDYGHIICLCFCFQFSIYMSNLRKECNIELTDFINPKKIDSIPFFTGILVPPSALFF